MSPMGNRRRGAKAQERLTEFRAKLTKPKHGTKATEPGKSARRRRTQRRPRKD
jgi:hypothetical protein